MPLLTEPGQTPSPPLSAAAAPEAGGRLRVRLGDELPIFCEKCGYSLHGLPQVRCERCEILHYACPECNHHQPINTLRPAAQRILGRIRAFALGFWVLVKLNFFGWLLFAWGAVGTELAYDNQWVSTPNLAGNRPAGTMRWSPYALNIESFIGTAVFALVFGVLGRMLLLRWRRTVPVGAVLGALVAAAMSAGAWLRWIDLSRAYPRIASPFGHDLLLLVTWTAGFVVLGAAIVWPIWLSLVHLFLPKRTAEALLDWQRGLSDPRPNEPALARE